MKKADLHLHTLDSDGTDTIDERKEQAYENSLDAIAITDHDTISDELEARSVVADNGVEVITGAEIKCEVDDIGIEILGYFIDPHDEEIHRMLDRLDNFRRARMEEIVYRLDGDLNTDISYQDVEDNADGPIGRPHLADALVQKGVVETQNQAFEEFIGEDSSYYVETEKLDAKEVITRIHANGGVTSLAHPGRDLDRENAHRIIDELVDNGLDALEVPYTYQDKRDKGYDINFGVAHARELAEEHDLLITGGSDCHGSQSDKYNIGKIALRYEHVEDLKELADQYQGRDY